jgi:NADH-quinone oxidoreductase subunit L
VFFGKAHHHGVHKPHAKFTHDLPLAVLALLALVGGFIPVGHVLDGVLPHHALSEEMEGKEHLLEAVSVAVSLSGVLLAWLIFGTSWERAKKIADSKNPILSWWRAAFGFDWLYDKLFVWPYMTFVRVNANDIVDQMIGLIPETFRVLNRWIATTQNGMLRWYAAAVGAGAVLVVGAVILH